MGKSTKRISALLCVMVMLTALFGRMAPEREAYADGGFLFDATKLTLNGIQNKDPVPEGTTFADNYYKTMGNVTYRTQNDEMIALELGKNMTGSFNFTSVGEADIVLVVASTGGANTSAFAIVDADSNIVPTFRWRTASATITALTMWHFIQMMQKTQTTRQKAWYPLRITGARETIYRS